MEKYDEAIPLGGLEVKKIVKVIEDADYLYKEYFNDNNFPTDNGKEGEIWNYINRGVIEQLPVEKFQIIVINRGRWKFLGIYDKTTKYFYTLMRDKNLKNLRKKPHEHLFHYLNALSKLNDGLLGSYSVDYQQMSMFLEDTYDEDGEATLESILEKMVHKIDGNIERYALIVFDAINGQVRDIRGVIPAKGLSYFKEENWEEHLSANYTDGSETAQESESTNDIIVLESKPRLKRRKKPLEEQTK